MVSADSSLGGTGKSFSRDGPYRKKSKQHNSAEFQGDTENDYWQQNMPGAKVFETRFLHAMTIEVLCQRCLSGYQYESRATYWARGAVIIHVLQM